MITQLPATKKTIKERKIFFYFDVSNKISEFLYHLILFIIYFSQDNEDMDNILEQLKQYSQPVIVCTINADCVSAYYIKLDTYMWQINKNCILEVFDIFFKCFYIFNIEYDQNFKRFFNFIEVYIYNIHKSPLSTVATMYNKIMFTKATL